MTADHAEGVIVETEAGAWDDPYHAPVLIQEVTTALAGARHVLDGTFGGGGHTAALLAQGAFVDALDQDPTAVANAMARLDDAVRTGRLRVFLANFASIDTLPQVRERHYDGVLLDLGVSSHQLDELGRGFSFRRGAPLDMRMTGGGAEVDARGGTRAVDLLNTASETELTRIFREYGDEPKAGRLARTVAHRRERHALETSDDLVGAIRAALGARTGPADFARLFQAVRIAVNDELGALEHGLPALRDRLDPEGRIAVISYHSGEDRIVKQAFRSWSAACRCPPRQLQCTCEGRPLGTTVTRRPITASAEEISRNPRARSARLRVWQRAA